VKAWADVGGSQTDRGLMLRTWMAKCTCMCIPLHPALFPSYIRHPC
jgi:hypothetical protein